VLERDDSREARRFEAVVAALQDVTPWLETWHPGSCSFGVKGPVRLSGGEANLVRRAARLASAALDDLVGSPAGHPGCGIGVADGRFAAGLAAGMADASGVDGGGAVVVPPGGVPAFLAPLSISVLERPALVDVLVRLGLDTLGAFAALPAADVVARFGAEGRDAHRLASGIDGRPPDPGPVPPDLAVSVAFDPPVERVDQAAFAARTLAEVLHGRLSDSGLACTLVLVEAETEHGERLARRWRDEGVLGPGALGSRPRRSTGSGWPGAGGTRGCWARGRWPTGCGGSWRGGSTGRRRPDPHRGSPRWSSPLTRWCRPPAASRGFGVGHRRPTSGRPGPASGWRASWAPGRCGYRSGAVAGIRGSAWPWCRASGGRATALTSPPRRCSRRLMGHRGRGPCPAPFRQRSTWIRSAWRYATHLVRWWPSTGGECYRRHRTCCRRPPDRVGRRLGGRGTGWWHGQAPGRWMSAGGIRNAVGAVPVSRWSLLTGLPASWCWRAACGGSPPPTTEACDRTRPTSDRAGFAE